MNIEDIIKEIESSIVNLHKVTCDGSVYYSIKGDDYILVIEHSEDMQNTTFYKNEEIVDPYLSVFLVDIDGRCVHGDRFNRIISVKDFKEVILVFKELYNDHINKSVKRVGKFRKI